MPRRHHVNLCCAGSVEPMVAEVARSLQGLGFETTVACGATARASLVGGGEGDDGPDEPTIHVVCVQAQLRDRVLGPLRRALADRDRPNQHLFVAILDLAMPLAMVGKIRRFAEALDDPFGANQKGSGPERRQWREHFGARPLGEVPTRDYRPLQIIDRTTATPSSSGARPRRPKFFSVGQLTRVGPTGKYTAIAAGTVTELDDPETSTLDGDVETTTPSLSTLEEVGKTSRYRIDDMLDTGSHSTLDSLAAPTEASGTTSQPPPRIGLASLLADGPLPATAIPRPLSTGVPTPLEDDDEPLAVPVPAAESASAMAKVALRRRTRLGIPKIVERPIKRSALGERGMDRGMDRGEAREIDRGQERRASRGQPAVTGLSDRPADCGRTEDGDAAAPETDTNDDTAAAEARPLAAVMIADSTARPRDYGRIAWLGAAGVVVAIAWFTMRPSPTPATNIAELGATNPVEAGLAPRNETPAPPHDEPRNVAPRQESTPSAPPKDDRAQANPRESTKKSAGIGRLTPPAPPRGVPPLAVDRTSGTPSEGTPAPGASAEVEEALILSPQAAANRTERLDAAVKRRTVRSINRLFTTRPRGVQTTSWDEAIAHCRDLTVAGITDWRLPWRKELKSIAVTLSYRSGIWWSRNQVSGDPDMVYGLDARSRKLGEYMKTEVTGAVVCVVSK